MDYQLQFSKRFKVARVLAVAVLVLSVLAVAVYAGACYLTSMSAIAVGEAAESSFTMQDFQVTIAELGFGLDVTAKQATYGLMVLVAMFLGFGVIAAGLAAASCIMVVRLPKNGRLSHVTFVFTAINGVIGLMSLRPVSGIMLLVVSGLMYSEYLAQVGAENEFSNANHLGLMRVIEICCLFMLVGEAFFLIFVTKSSYYDAAYWVDFIRMLMVAVTLWLLMNRKAHSREIIMGMVAIYLGLSLVVQFAVESFSPTDYLFGSLFPVAMLVYFATSRRARAVLVQPWTKDKEDEAVAEDQKLWNPRSLLFWRNLALYFCIFSVMGHWMEWCVCWLIRWGLVPGTYDPNSGIWYDMLNPFFVYGAAMVFIGLLLFPLKNWLQAKIKIPLVPLLLSFLVNSLFCAAIELAMGLVMNTPPDPVTGKLPLWDYHDMAFNFMGQICLLNTTFFGVMATLMTWLAFPNLQRLFAKVPHDVMTVISVVVYVFFALVVCMYVINLNLATNLAL